VRIVLKIKCDMSVLLLCAALKDATKSIYAALARTLRTNSKGRLRHYEGLLSLSSRASIH
jgi:hypothetical protein